MLSQISQLQVDKYNMILLTRGNCSRHRSESRMAMTRGRWEGERGVAVDWMGPFGFAGLKGLEMRPAQWEQT